MNTRINNHFEALQTIQELIRYIDLHSTTNELYRDKLNELAHHILDEIKEHNNKRHP
jgi:hypothetical protein